LKLNNIHRTKIIIGFNGLELVKAAKQSSFKLLTNLVYFDLISSLY